MLRERIQKSFHRAFIISLGLATSLVLTSLIYAQTDSIWEDMRLYGGQITAIAVDPQDNSTLYASSWLGDGLFKSRDSGQTWMSVPIDAPLFRNLDVYDIAIDPGNSANIWIADNQYVHVSHDYGATWEKLYFAAGFHRYCYTVAVDPHDATGNTVYVGTSGMYYGARGTIFKTSDGGKSWFEVLRNADYNIFDISINPNQPGEIWAVSSPYAEAVYAGVIYVSTNNCLSWFKFEDYLYSDGVYYRFGALNEILVHPVNQMKIFACGMWGVFKKTDGAKKTTDWRWTDIDDIARALCIPQTEPDNIYVSFIYFEDGRDKKG